jgi:hypothetical protein
MNIKHLKTKQLVALALALFMVVPMLLAAAPLVKAAGGPATISIVPTGASGVVAGTTTNIPVQGTTTTFQLDVRVDNYANINIGGTNNGVSGISYVVSWDPTVLQYVSKTDASWLPSQSNSGDLTNHVTTGQLTIGQTAFDTSDPMQTASSSTGSVSVTITFRVLSTGTSMIALSPQTGVAYLAAPETVAGVTSGHAVTGTLTANAQYNPMTTISLYKTGTSTNIINGPASPIGQTFGVDIYMNNPLSVQIWAWNLGVTWNPAAVQLTSITEGTYLSAANPNNNAQGSATIFVPGFINNQLGIIPQGISDAYLTDSTTNAASGVMATLTFTVINYANSNINLVQGIPSLETLSGTTPVAITPAPILNNAQYISPQPPAPTSPIAKITDVPSSTTYTNGYTLPTAFTSAVGTFQLTAANSVAGNDVVPNPANPSFPITTYAWTVTQGASLLTLTNPSSQAISFATPTVTSLTTFTLQLVVSSASNPGDLTYVPTSTPVTLSFSVQPASYAPTTIGPLIDIYVVNPLAATTTNRTYSPNGNNGNPLTAGTSAYSPNAFCDAFGPQEQMNLAALVTYNGAPVANKEVTIQISDNKGNVIGTLTALTNESGIAIINYRLPWFDGSYTNGPQSEFGIWIVYGSVMVQQTIVGDTMPFKLGDIISITDVQLGAQSLPRSTTTTETDQTVTVSLSGISDQTQNYWMTYTVIDNGNVPVANGLVSGTMTAATYTVTSGNLVVTSSTGSVGPTSFKIPSYAFVGGATININVFNADPLNAQNKLSNPAVPYCPQASNTFTISIPYGV